MKKCVDESADQKLSNYEKYAIVKQQELLHKEKTLQEAIGCLRERQKFVSV